MFINSLEKKPKVIDNNGQEIIDLTVSMLGNHADQTFSFYKIPKEFEMRPDLISQSLYNSTDYVEFILKYNGISNGFTIQADDVIAFPNLSNLQNNINPLLITNNSLRIQNASKYIDPTKIPKDSASAKQYENQQRVMSATPNSMPANIAEKDENQIEIENGRVYFGRSIGQSACLQNGMRSGEYLNKLISK